MNIKFKKLHQNAITPTYGTTGAACFDFYACDAGEIHGMHSFSNFIVGTGISMEIPEGFVMKIYSRSGHAFKSAVRLANGVGVIDSDYRGEIKIKLQGDFGAKLVINPGDRIAQGMIEPAHQVSFVEVEELGETARGTGGFGSTGS
jgi:dUTP pyrophosphatase